MSVPTFNSGKKYDVREEFEKDYVIPGKHRLRVTSAKGRYSENPKTKGHEMVIFAFEVVSSDTIKTRTASCAWNVTKTPDNWRDVRRLQLACLQTVVPDAKITDYTAEQWTESLNTSISTGDLIGIELECEAVQESYTPKNARPDEPPKVFTRLRWFVPAAPTQGA